ncbi:uncharacterized protein [Dermacentor albipictus]|uniref:uncharacterized protein n=1 Tax=Dermacentor albipictus TaxID=60249 RepID=UPI0031FBA994
MGGAQYVLTGFGDFFERRRIAFVDPLPRSHVCCACGFVSSLSVRLPCNHVFCRLCRSQIPSDGARCPVEGTLFKKDDVASQTIELPDLEHLRVFCTNGGGSGQRCNFVGKLSELPAHVYECGYDEVKCENCDGAVTRNAAVDHRRQCSADLPLAGPTGKAAEVAAAKGDPGAVVEDVKTLRQRASWKQVDQEGFEKKADSSLAECATDHRTHSIRAKGTYSGEVKEPDTSSAGPVSSYLAPGPPRTASKQCVFTAWCRFDNIYEKYEELQYKYAASAVTKGCAGGAYPFSLKCTLTKEEENGGVELYFSLYLRSGEWDSYDEWPLSKDVTVILTHPSNKEKDVRFPVCIFKRDRFEKPAPLGATCNEAHPMIDGESWERMELGGFIHKNALNVIVEFE